MTDVLQIILEENYIWDSSRFEIGIVLGIDPVTEIGTGIGTGIGIGIETGIGIGIVTIEEDHDQEVVRNVVQRAKDHPNNRMPTVPTMTGHLVNTRPETELSLKQWRAIIMMIR